MRKAVIFDLDGTLTRSEEGIWRSVEYAADALGFPRPDAETLRKFIGPPLDYSFRTYMGMSAEDAQRAVAAYRVRYNDVGLFENRVYPGIRRLLRMLHRAGVWCAIATGKPQGPSERIVRHFLLDGFFDRIVGTDGVKADKRELILRALPDTFDEAWMIGDRRFDVEGGRAAGVRTIGVGYGYGSEEELRNAQCDVYCPAVQDVIDTLCPGEEPPTGAFLSVEGLDGSGKTTQLALLTDALDRFGFEVARSREPGGCLISEKIRDLLLDRANAGMTAQTEALLYAAARAQHVREVIVPAMRQGRVVLCDRYVDSSVAYQGGGRELGVDTVLQMNAPATGGVMPLATVYLDIRHEDALRRRVAASEPDRIEMETECFHARVESAYRELIARDPGRFVVVDATLAPEEIGAEAARRVIARLVEAEHG